MTSAASSCRLNLSLSYVLSRRARSSARSAIASRVSTFLKRAPNEPLAIMSCPSVASRAPTSCVWVCMKCACSVECQVSVRCEVRGAGHSGGKGAQGTREEEGLRDVRREPLGCELPGVFCKREGGMVGHMDVWTCG
eukprot:358615-Chlamydomonas_euryale.AAC.2